MTSSRPKDDTVFESDTYQQESVARLTEVNPAARGSRPKDDTVSERDTYQQVSVTGLTEENPAAPCHNTHPQNQTSETPSSVQCLQVNLRKTHQALVSLFLDILNKNVYKNGIDVIFITEPPNVTKANALTDVPDDVFNVFAEKCGRAAHDNMEMSSVLC